MERREWAMKKRPSIPHAWARKMQLIERTNGRFFAAEFVKQDGTLRRMVCRYGVRKFTRRLPPRNDPYQTGLAIVWDTAEQEYRIITLATMFTLRCGALIWHATPKQTVKAKKTCKPRTITREQQVTV
jgi:hypothetical protein